MSFSSSFSGVCSSNDDCNSQYQEAPCFRLSTTSARFCNRQNDSSPSQQDGPVLPILCKPILALGCEQDSRPVPWPARFSVDKFARRQKKISRFAYNSYFRNVHPTVLRETLMDKTLASHRHRAGGKFSPCAHAQQSSTIVPDTLELPVLPTKTRAYYSHQVQYLYSFTLYYHLLRNRNSILFK